MWHKTKREEPSRGESCRKAVARRIAEELMTEPCEVGDVERRPFGRKTGESEVGPQTR